MKEGRDRPVPQSGWARYGFLLVSHFWKLMAANLLFLLFSLPILTMPAALAALNRVCIKLVREGNCLLWEEFRGEFRASLVKGLLIGLPYGLLLAASYYLLSLARSNSGSIYGIAFFALGLCAFYACASFGSWAFVLLAMLELPVRSLQQNARALTALEFKRTLAAMGITVLSVFLTLALFPYSVVLVVLLLPAIGQFSIVSLYYPAVLARVIAPYEHSKQNEPEIKNR
ncbi:MAG: YesL family protein [Christensenella sp.]|nr:YesL family protein [Christensenella sp.]